MPSFKSNVIPDMLNKMLSSRVANDLSRSLASNLYALILKDVESVSNRHELTNLCKDAFRIVTPGKGKVMLKEVLTGDALYKFLRPHLIYNPLYFRFANETKANVGFNVSKRYALITFINKELKVSKFGDVITKLEAKLFGPINDNLRKMAKYNNVTEEYVLNLLNRGSGLLLDNRYPAVVLTGGWKVLRAVVQSYGRDPSVKDCALLRELLIKHSNRIFTMQSPDMYAEIYPKAYQIRCKLSAKSVCRWNDFVSPVIDDSFEKVFSKLSVNSSAMALAIMKENRVLEKTNLDKVIIPVKMRGTVANTIANKSITRLICYVLFTPNKESIVDKVNLIRSEDFFKACIMQTRNKLRSTALKLKRYPKK